MELTPDSHLRDFTLTAFGAVTLCLAMLIGLGWLLKDHDSQVQVAEVLGQETELRLWDWYAHKLDAMFPDDSDDDGYSNGLEFFLGTEPLNPQSHPDYSVTHTAPQTDYLFCGETTRVRWVIHGSVSPFRFPPSFRAKAAAEHAMIVAGGNGEALVKLSLVAPNSAGEIEIAVRGDRVDEHATVFLTHAASGRDIGQATFDFVGWRGRAAEVEWLDKDLKYLRDSDTNPDTMGPRFTWKREAQRLPKYVLERRQKEPGAEWQGNTLLTDADEPHEWLWARSLEIGKCVWDYEWRVIVPMPSATPTAASSSSPSLQK